MKKTIKALAILAAWIAIVPAGAGYGIMWLWNNLLPAICGFTAISFLQGVGLFFLGQLLSAGFMVGLFLLGGSLHASFHHSHHNHWHEMSEEQRREFIEQRRRWFEMRHHDKSRAGNEGE